MQVVLPDACVLLRHLARVSHNATIQGCAYANRPFFSSAPLAVDPPSSLQDPSSRLTSAPSAAPSDAYRVSSDLDSEIREYASLPQTPVSLQMLMKAGQLADGTSANEVNDDSDASWATPLQRRPLYRSQRGQERILLSMARLLRQEIPIRLAQRISDLDRVPMMRDMPSVMRVKDVYRASFRALRVVPPILTTKDESDFAYVLSQLYEKHSGVLVEMARGAYEMRDSMLRSNSDPHGGEFALLSECHAFLDRFYTSRIGIRVLVGQYLALRQQYQYGQGTSGLNSNYIGMICLDCSPRDVVRQAADLSRRLCRQRYGGRAPLVQISGRLDLTFPYIPAYLQYVLLELLKNSLRAVSERHGQGALPPVQVVIADGHDQEDVVIKIADEGGGIARSQMAKIWSYLYTTADPNVQRQFIGIGRGGEDGEGIGGDAGTPKDHDVQDSSPIAGLGYGLPISRSYCRYFGGDLSLESMQGYGTDVFIHLKRLGDTNEPSLDVPSSRSRN